ncbi:hypothetical protein GOP47_0026352 [Adiantum capillus-veneris]|nr:hypothetical protein GOP47_0026352 [Adiantum capillus-veneris]
MMMDKGCQLCGFAHVCACALFKGLPFVGASDIIPFLEGDEGLAFCFPTFFTCCQMVSRQLARLAVPNW